MVSNGLYMVVGFERIRSINVRKALSDHHVNLTLNKLDITITGERIDAPTRFVGAWLSSRKVLAIDLYANVDAASFRPRAWTRDLLGVQAQRLWPGWGSCSVDLDQAGRRRITTRSISDVLAPGRAGAPLTFLGIIT